jgi:sugar lactone lactonase YvrE
MAVAGALLAVSAFGQGLTPTVYAGLYSPPYTITTMQLTQAEFASGTLAFPSGVAVDKAGNIYVSNEDYWFSMDSNAGGGVYWIDMITPSGVSTQIAGSWAEGYTDGPGNFALFNNPTGVAVDNGGNVYVADSGNNVIRKIAPKATLGTSAWTVSTVAGVPGGGFADGPASSAAFNNPMGVTVDRFGNVFVADTGNNSIRMITAAGVVTTIAGSPTNPLYLVDGVGSAATFSQPSGIAVDDAGNVYVADTGHCVIRLLTPTESNGTATSYTVTTLAGVPHPFSEWELMPNYPVPVDGAFDVAVFNRPTSVAVDGAGYVYVADTGDDTIRRITPEGFVTTLAGGDGYTVESNYGSINFPGWEDGTGSSALFSSPEGLAVDQSGNIYVADTNNSVIRKGSPANVLYLTAQPQSQTQLPDGSASFRVEVSAGPAAAFQWQVLANGGTTWTPLADGKGVSGSTSQTLQVGPAGLFNGDQFECVVTAANGSVTTEPATLTVHSTAQVTPYTFGTMSGTTQVEGGTDGLYSGATLAEPEGVVVDGSGTIYVADTFNSKIRAISPTGVLTTLAGTPGTFGNRDGVGPAAAFGYPDRLALDDAGNLYVSDMANDNIRKITPTVVDGKTTWVVTTLAGAPGEPGGVDGPGSVAQFNQPTGLAVDGAGNVYVADTNNDTIREVTPAGFVTTVAGLAGQEGSVDGTGSAARFNQPSGVALDSAGNLYVSDSNNETIREITPGGAVTTIAGTAGKSGAADGPASEALFGSPAGIVLDPAGDIYVADAGNDTVRELILLVANGVTTWTVTTLGGEEGSYGRNADPLSVALDGEGNLYLADAGDDTIRKLAPTVEDSSVAWVLSVIAGTPGDRGGMDGTGFTAQYDSPQGVAVDGSGNVYVADTGNDTIREIGANGVVSTLAGTALAAGSADGTGGAARFNGPDGVAVDGSGNVYVADTGNDTIRKISPGGVVATLAGSPGQAGSSDGEGSAARFNQPGGVAVDGAGNVYVADTGNDTIREITAGGLVSTLAGTAGVVGGADGTGGAALFNAPSGLAVDASGNLTVADSGNNSIRRIKPGGATTTLAGIAGAAGGTSDGVGAGAQFTGPKGVAVDAQGYVYVADTGNTTIRRISPGGQVTTLAGDPADLLPYAYWSNRYSDGTGTSALFNFPAGVAVDGSGNVYVADTGNDTIREGTTTFGANISILSQPQSQVVNAGSGVALAVDALDILPLTLSYQWNFNGTPIPGATGAALSIGDAEAASAGSYSVMIKDSAGITAVSNPATLTVNPAAASAITSQPISQTVAIGGTAVFTVGAPAAAQAAPAESAALQSLTYTYPDTTYQWQFNGAYLADGDGISGSAGPQLLIQGVSAANIGDYSCIVTTAGVISQSNAASLAVVSTSNPGALSSISARAFVGTGDNILIGGFYISGNTSATILAQAIGPALAASSYNVTGALQHPALTIHQIQNGKDVVLYSNTGWGSSPVVANSAVAAGAQPVLQPGSADSELLLTLPPGGYTAEVSGADGGTGVALCAIYQLP